MGTGLLLGYGLGSLNTAFAAAREGWPLGQILSRDQDSLCTALAVSLCACAILYFVGFLIEHPINLEWSAVQDPANKKLIWICLALTGFAYLTGTMGFRGVQNAAHKESILGALITLITAILPSYTVLVFGRPGSRREVILKWGIVAIELVVLLSQGRRILLYAVVVMFIALTVQGVRFELTNMRTILSIACAAGALYFGMQFFFAVRYVRSQSAKGSRVGMLQAAGQASDLLIRGDSRLGADSSRNLRSRTFVLGYLSDLLDASATRKPMLGEALLFNLRMSVPSFLDPNKEDVRVLGAEEVVVNPEFGLRVEDDPNSIITTGVADFGVLGGLLYPVLAVVCLTIAFRGATKCAPVALSIFMLLGLANTLLQTELTTMAYFVNCRNILLVLGLLWIAQRIANAVVRATPTQQRPAFPRWAVVVSSPTLIRRPTGPASVEPRNTGLTTNRRHF